MALNLLVWSTAIFIIGDLGHWCKVHSFLPNLSTSLKPFSFPVKTIHKINWILLISLQILVKSFVSNIIIDLLYNLSNYMQYKHDWKLFEVGSLNQHIVIAFCHLVRDRKLIATAYFKNLNWIYKTVYCISCSMVFKIIFCFEFLNIPDKAGRKTTRRRRTRTIAKCYGFGANAIRK